MFFEDSKKRYKRLVIIVVALFIALLICGFFTYRTISSSLGVEGTTKKDKYNINSMDYHLRSNATEYQVELFGELSKLVDDGTDDLAIAESVVKNFIADAYTFNNKKGQWDVGGMYYIYSPMKVNFYYLLKDSFYGLMNKYIDDYGASNLLEVTNIEILSSEKAENNYEVDGNSYECFVIKCKWDYAEGSKLASSVDNCMMFDVIKNNDGRFEIVVNYESE